MKLIKDLKDSLLYKSDLQKFITKRIDDLYDYYSIVNFNSLDEQRDLLRSLPTSSSISELDYRNPKNEVFLNLLITNSTRLNEPFAFDFFHNLLIENGLKEPLIVQASSFFMKSTHANEFINCYDNMLKLLNESYLSESDGSKDPVVALLNFYATAVAHFAEFNQSRLLEIKKLISDSRINDNEYFLKEQVIEDALKVDVDFDNMPYLKIQALIDSYLKRDTITLPYDVIDKIIETGTAYSDIISQNHHSIEDIWQLNRDHYKQLVDTDIIFQSLGRGTAVLDNEEQMTVYMSQLGKMHIAKLRCAFEGLPSELTNVHLFDWGCSQGPAARIFLDKYSGKNVKSVTLIEPSEPALSRASLHVSQDSKSVRTVNKDFDSLEVEDIELRKIEEDITVHIFSNVIDMEFFSLHDIVDLLIENSNGITYFLVVSPFIDTTKTQRIRTFVDEICEKVLSHEILLSEEKRSGSWIGSWSKVIRVFKVNS